MPPERLTNCVQATPDCALLLIAAQVSGPPDAARYLDFHNSLTFIH
jgi:hypothetical protein